MKRISIMLALIIILLSILPICASDITDANYYGVVRATNNSTLAEKVSANFSCNTTALIAAGIVNSTVNNTAMRSGGSDIAFMPGYGTNPWIAYYASIPANSSVDAILYTNVSGGELRYFPGTGGMTTPDDNADLEPGDNGTIKIKGYFDTTQTGANIVSKVDAARVYISAPGAVTATIAPEVYSNQLRIYSSRFDGGVGYTDLNITLDVYYSGAWHNIQNGTVTKDTWVTLPIGSSQYVTDIRISTTPTAGFQSRIYELNIYDLDASAWQVPFSGSGATWFDVAKAYDGNTGTYAYIWNDTDLISFVATNGINKSVSLSGVSVAEHTLTMTLDTANLTLAIDSSSNTTALAGATCGNTTANWVTCSGTVMPYVEYQKIYVNGELRQSIAWEYGTTFNDLSAFNNDATPTFRTTCSDPDVTATLISFTPIVISTVSSDVIDDWPSMVTTPPDQPATTYTEETRPGIFFEPIVYAIWVVAGGLPESLFFYNFSFFWILATGILVYWAFAKQGKDALLLKIIAMLAVMVFFALPGPNIYGMYVAIYFALWSFGVLVLSRSYGW